jgi:hypothetical protein
VVGLVIAVLNLTGGAGDLKPVVGIRGGCRGRDEERIGAISHLSVRRWRVLWGGHCR